MDPNSIRIVSNSTRPPSVHSLRSALKTLDLPSMPPTVPLPPLPTSPSSIKSRTATFTGASAGPTFMGSTKKASLTSISFRPHKPIKYGTGKFSHVELVPQPSDDLQDPLNWPQWKKELNLASLLFIASLIGAMKTSLVAANEVIATQYRVSYTWVAALTAAPLMVSAVAGFLSSVAAKLVGKRPIYLVSSAFIFSGCIWNMTADSSYGSCMGARVLQGLGWGAFDTLLMETIQDTFYDHERNIRVSLYTILTITTTWASPLLGGVISYRVGTFVAQYRVISALFAVAIPLLALTAPETAFDRSKAAIATTPVLSFPFPWEPQQTHIELSRDSAIDYVKEMKPWSFTGGENSHSTWIQVPRALAAPTTTLVFIVTALPHCTLWGFVTSLSLLLSPSPFSLQPSIIGTLLTGPWILPVLLIVGICFYRSAHRSFTRCVSSLMIAAGALLSLMGLLSFGLNVGSFISWPTPSSNEIQAPFFTSEVAKQLNLPLVSLQLGLLAAGASTLEAASRPLLARSASFTASSMATAQRSIGDMHSWVIILRNLLAGSFVLAVPHIILKVGGLKVLVIGLATAQAGITISVLLLWHFCEKSVWRMDGKVMGLVNLRMPHPDESFFDTD